MNINQKNIKETVKMQSGSRIMCKASEIGKIIVNKCLQNEIEINNHRKFINSCFKTNIRCLFQPNSCLSILLQLVHNTDMDIRTNQYSL